MIFVIYLLITGRAMEYDLKFALSIVVAAFFVIIASGVIAVAN